MLREGCEASRKSLGDHLRSPIRKQYVARAAALAWRPWAWRYCSAVNRPSGTRVYDRGGGMGQREGGPGNGDRLAPPVSSLGMPPWAPRLVVLAILFVAVAIGAIGVIRELRGLISNLIFAMFLSFALEPAVN